LGSAFLSFAERVAAGDGFERGFDVVADFTRLQFSFSLLPLNDLTELK
jgi:hypothetical protein